MQRNFYLAIHHPELVGAIRVSLKGLVSGWWSLNRGESVEPREVVGPLVNADIGSQDVQDSRGRRGRMEAAV